MAGSASKLMGNRGGGRDGLTTAGRTRLYSIGALLTGRQFTGSFELDGTAHKFSYSPTKAALVGNRLQLTGDFLVAESRAGSAAGSQAGKQKATLRNVRATLVGSQGGLGTAPSRTKRPPEVYAPRPDVPPVDSSGSLSFAGVLYFHFEPLRAESIGLNADLSRLQLNARLFPADDRERTMQAAYSSIVDALLAKEPDQKAGAEAIEELNKLLAG